MNEGNSFGAFPIQNKLPLRWAILVQKPLKLGPRNNRGEFLIIQFRFAGWVKEIVSCGDNNHAGIDNPLLGLRLERNRPLRTGRHTGVTPLFREMATATRIDESGIRVMRWRGQDNSFPFHEPPCLLIRHLYGTYLQALPAPCASRLVHIPGTQGNLRLIISYKPFQVNQFPRSQDLDILVGLNQLHQRCQELACLGHVGKGVGPFGHVPPQIGLPFEQGHLKTCFRHVFGCRQSRNSPSDDQSGGDHGGFFFLKGFLKMHAGNRRGHQLLRLLRGNLAVRMHPGTLLPDIGLLEIVGVDPTLLHDLSKGRLVHPGGAGRDNHSVQLMFPDIFPNHLLSRIGTHVLVILGEHDIRKGLCVIPHGGHVHNRGDIDAAMTDVNPDPHAASSLDRIVMARDAAPLA